jgi:hypothetical protein
MTGKRGIALRSRIRLARLEHAATRWESAAVIGLTIVTTPAVQLIAVIGLVPDWAWIAVLLFGTVAELSLILSSATDPDAGTGFVVSVLETHFDVPNIRDEAIRQLVARGFEYRARMEGVLGGKRQASRGELSETVAHVDRWIGGIARLARRLDGFRGEALFQAEEKHRLQDRIAGLESQSQAANDEKVKRQVRKTAAGHKHQFRMIVEWENLMERGALQLEHAVGALGTIYTQTALVTARGMDAGEATRLSSEIAEEARQVDTVLAAMDRVYEPDPGGDGEGEYP